MREDHGKETTTYRMQVLLERLLLPQRSRATAEIAEELESLCKKLKTLLPAREWDPFAAQLMARQGSIVPDFESLYREKSRLDRILSGQPQ
jgi:hypothetical protein